MEILFMPFRCLCIVGMMAFSFSIFAQPVDKVKKVKTYHFVNYNEKSGASRLVISVNAGKYGDVFAGSLNGLIVGKRDETRTYSFRKYLDSLMVRGVYMDANRILYVATDDGIWLAEDDGGGGYYFFSHYDSSSGLISNETNCIYADEKGIIYVGAQSDVEGEGGLSVGEKDMNGNYHFTSYDESSGLGANNVRRIFADKDGIIYAATSNGLSIGEKNHRGKYRFTNYTTSSRGFGSNNVFGLYVDEAKTVYVASYEGGVSIGQKAPLGQYSFSNYTTSSGLASNIAWGVYVNKQGDLFVATENGLSIGKQYYHGKQYRYGKQYDFTNYTMSSGLGSNEIKDVFVDSDNIIYAATYDLPATGNGGLSIGKEN